ncbi:MAG: cation:proton antiporter [Burkholderiaceae bacterium]
MTIGLLIVALFTVSFSLTAKRFASTVFTAPMLYIGLGVVLASSHLLPDEGVEATLHIVAEVALIVLLFLDAAQVDMRTLGRHHIWPLRMLLIGLPLSVILGTITTQAFFPEWPLVTVALVAAILAPTDAALSQAVVSNPIVPVRPRRALTVESGLNDGLALPLILLLASLTAHATDKSSNDWLLFGAKQMLLGPAVGIAGGLIGGKALLLAKSYGLTSKPFEGIAAIAMACAIYLAATAIGGNGFIAAFVAGLCFGYVVKGACAFVYEFTESEGQLLSWGSFFLLGLALVPEAVKHLDWPTFATIVVSLFVVRPLAIWLSLLGTDASTTTRLFFGWFGPRGLATALFALLVVKQIDPEYGEPILNIAVNAVWISALLHGLSAASGARWYAQKILRMGDCAENDVVEKSGVPLKTHDD